MNNEYYQGIDTLEKGGVSRDYILGWAAGFLGNPEIEEQRRTEAWSAGFEAGQARTTDGCDEWTADTAA